MIISVRQLKLIHYYYFAMGIFSFTNAIFAGIGTFLSYIFLVFYGIFLIISWYIAYVARKQLREYIIISSRSFFIKHIALTVGTVLLTSFIWIFGIIPEAEFLYMLMFANYLVFFMAGMWYILTRTDFVRSLFAFYDKRQFRKAKEFIIRTRKENFNYYGRELITAIDINEYQYGFIVEVDEMMESARDNRANKQYALECLGRIELALARKRLDVIGRKMTDMTAMAPTPVNLKELGKTQREFKDLEHDIIEFEKLFYEKSGAIQ